MSDLLIAGVVRKTFLTLFVLLGVVQGLVVVETWSGTPHSYGLVGQELAAALDDVLGEQDDVILVEAPVYRSDWPRNGSGLLDSWLRNRLVSLERRERPHWGCADLVVRSYWPLDVSAVEGCPSTPVFVLGTSEYHVAPAEVWQRAPAVPWKSLSRQVTLVAPSRWARDGFVEAGVPAGQVVVVAHGQSVMRADGRDVMGLRRGRGGGLRWASGLVGGGRERCVGLLSVGAMTGNKGVEGLLVAFDAMLRRLEATGTDVCVRLVLKGLDPLYGSSKRVEKLMEDLELRESTRRRVVVSGEAVSQERMRMLFRAASAVVAPYSGEGFALPVAEAMAAGTPVVVPGGNGVPTDDFVDDEVAIRVPCDRASISIYGEEGWGVLVNRTGLAAGLLKVVLGAPGAREALRAHCAPKDENARRDREICGAVPAATAWYERAVHLGPTRVVRSGLLWSRAAETVLARSRAARRRLGGAAMPARGPETVLRWTGNVLQFAPECVLPPRLLWSHAERDEWIELPVPAEACGMDVQIQSPSSDLGPHVLWILPAPGAKTRFQNHAVYNGTALVLLGPDVASGADWSPWLEHGWREGPRLAPPVPRDSHPEHTNRDTSAFRVVSVARSVLIEAASNAFGASDALLSNPIVFSRRDAVHLLATLGNVADAELVAGGESVVPPVPSRRRPFRSLPHSTDPTTSTSLLPPRPMPQAYALYDPQRYGGDAPRRTRPELRAMMRPHTLPSDGPVVVVSPWMCIHSEGKAFAGLVAALARTLDRQMIVAAVAAVEDGVRSCGCDTDDPLTALLRGSGARLLPLCDLSQGESLSTLRALKAAIAIFPTVGVDPVPSNLARSRVAARQIALWGSPDPGHASYYNIDLFLSPPTSLPATGAWILPPAISPITPQDAITLRHRILSIHKKPSTAPLLFLPHTLAKIGPEVDLLLAHLLERHPDALILLLQGTGPWWEAAVRRRWSLVHSPMRHLQNAALFLPRLSPTAIATMYQAATAVIDSTPYSSFTVPLESLAAGTPFLALDNSPLLRSQLAPNLLRHAGLAQWIAPTPQRMADILQDILQNPPPRHTAQLGLQELRRYNDDVASALRNILNETYAIQ